MIEYTETTFNNIKKERNVISSGKTITRIIIESNELTCNQADKLYKLCAEELTRIVAQPKDKQGKTNDNV
jgi:hypothetical protein